MQDKREGNNLNLAINLKIKTLRKNSSLKPTMLMMD